MIDNYQLTEYNYPEFDVLVRELIKENPVLIASIKNASTGNWSLARLWRAWMSTTAEFMAANGCKMPLMIDKEGKPYGERPFDANDAHELFTNNWLGTDESGKRLSWSKSGRDDMRAATKGERFHALQKHENWCLEKGITLINPIDSQYRELQQESEQ